MRRLANILEREGIRVAVLTSDVPPARIARTPALVLNPAPSRVTFTSV